MSAPSSAVERWFRLLLRLYPADFRDEMGDGFVETYLDRSSRAAARGGRIAVARVCVDALNDSIRNGVAERASPAVAWRHAGNWGRDAEFALRRLTRAPVFSLAMIATLIVGLGAFGVVFTVVQKTLIAPLPYPRSNDLYFAWRDYGPVIDMRRGWLAGPDVAELATVGGPILAAAGIRRDRRTIAAANGVDGNPEEVDLMVSSPNLFDILGAHPMLGRTFAPNEIGKNRAPVIVLGYDLWQRRFNGDRAVIGRGVKVNGTLYTVIGVMPRDFRFVRHSTLGAPEAPADAYVTFNYVLAETAIGAGRFAGLIRARPGSSSATVGAAVAAVGRSIDERYFKGSGSLAMYSVGLESDLLSPVRPALMVLALSGVFLALVLTVNLATLLLTRAMHRERELAVTRALGANPMALLRATLFESAMLGFIGGVGATLVAWSGTRLLVALAPIDFPRRDSIVVDVPVALAIVGIGTLLGFVAGAAPAAWAARTNLSTLLRTAAVRGGGGRLTLRRALVVAQVGLSIVLLSTGALVVRSFERLLQSNPGFEPSGVLTMRVAAGQWHFSSKANAVAFDAQFERELANIPGVALASAASSIPFTGGTAGTSNVFLPGAPGNDGVPEHDAPIADLTSARPGWFATLGIRLLSGRDFSPRRAGARREVVIDRTLAEQFYPNAEAVGRPLVVLQDTMVIVGVVNHPRLYDVHKDGRPQVYLRDEDDTAGPLYFAIRTSRDPRDLVVEVREALHRVDAQLAISQVRPMEDIVDDSLRQQRVSAVLIAGFSIGALLLASMGLFAVIAGSVTRRRHEIAVRIALGAEETRVLGLVLSEGAALVALGVVLAVPAVYVAGRLLRGVLVGISPFDPVTLAAVVLVFSVVALLACYLPARRVGSIDPARMLREG